MSVFLFYEEVYTVSTKLIENPRINPLQSRGQTFLLEDTKKRSSPVFSTSLSMESLPLRDLEGNEIDRSGGGESFTAIRHLNWLNADKLQRYTLSRTLPYRCFFCTFSPTSPSPRGRLAIWKFPTGRMCRILRGSLR